MSHITAVQGEIKDLEAVKALCKEKGWEFMEGQTTYRWYGKLMGGSPIPAGMKVEDYGKCDHAIRVPGATYEIGLRKNAKGNYDLAFDSWKYGGLEAVIGATGGLFMQGYGLAKAEREAKKRGLNCRRIAGQNGKIKLVLTGHGI